MRKLPLAAVAAALSVAVGVRAEIDLKNFDLAVKPQDDFYLYANGTWQKNIVMPADQARWGAFTELAERNSANVRAICERVAAKGAAGTAIERLVGDFYASGMDEAAINAAGATPLQSELGRLAAIKTPADVMTAIAHLRLIGVASGFAFGGGPDAKNSDMTIAQLRQGGISLPSTGAGSAGGTDRDYYLSTDEKIVKIREQYLLHVGKLFELSGEAPATAKANAEGVLRLETELAKASLSRAVLRNPQANYHKLKVTDLPAYTGDLDWPAFFAAAGAPKFDELNLAQPEFFKGFAATLKASPIADWQAYLKWKLLHDAAPFLSTAFATEDFHFNSVVITGVADQKPRWRRVGSVIDSRIGEALGQLYVAEYFPPESKTRVLNLVEDLRAALADRIHALEWMDAPTKTKALAKLKAFGVKIGYPDKWKDYSALKIDRGPYVLNVFRAAEFEVRRNLAKIGQPVDKTEFGMTPPTVNASYSPPTNSITFPAGILQPPFFDPKADDAVNYGGIGTVIGHEMTHGFDDSGRQYDAQGNLVDWWTPESAEKFKVRAAAVVKQYSDYTVLDGVHLKGELTQGENIADLGGVKIAYYALQKALTDKPRDPINGFTPEQRFFLSYASLWRDVFREAEQRKRVNTDPHSPGEWRVRGPLSNLDEFAKAFNVSDGSMMRRPAETRTTIW
jgi:predicted metalloendopeptidase